MLRQSLIPVLVFVGLLDGAPGEPASRPGRAAATQPANDITATRPASPSPEAIREAVRQLSHPLPAKRRAAIQDLAAWGPLAFGELRRAAESDDLEAALLARELLAELESAILIGAQVRLKVDRPRVPWDEPVTLAVVARNPTAGPIRVPWPEPSRGAASQPAADDAGQVAAMLDAADFLCVVRLPTEASAGEQEIELRVDPIDRATAVYQAVDVRARGTPPSHLVPPGGSATLVIPAFNRGWARFPMLSPGTYEIRFAYQPEWKDASWTEAAFGVVRAEPVRVEVLTGAPEPVRRASGPMALRLRREGDTLLAELQNTWDRRQWVNLNLGAELTTHAKIEWRMTPVHDEGAEPVCVEPEPAVPAFTSDNLYRLEPAGMAVISRMPITRLIEHARQEELDPARGLSVSVRYVHLATPALLRERLRDLGRPANIPAELFTGSLGAEPIPIAPAPVAPDADPPQ